jgi:glycosyltransferase involved in cell wall biosynthesis
MLANALPAVSFSPFGRRVAHPRALYIGSYPPRECGIATFTEDVKMAVDRRAGMATDVVAINENGRRYVYPLSVIGGIERDDVVTYVNAARIINAHPCDVVNIQHEYGLFGGKRGDMLIELLARVNKPIVTTLHTVLPEPDHALRAVTRELCNRSDAVIVLAETGKRLLEHYYGIDSRKVKIVLHGAPDVPLRSSRHFKRRFGLEKHTLISTFGLLSPGKGIEYLLDALPAVFDRHPNAIYLLLGETHPSIRAREGEAYRDSLLERARSLGIAGRVRFVNRYMAYEEIVSYLLATDVYASPSLDPNQIVSGTLSYAVACGRVVVATASAYASELLADGRGIVVPFRSAAALSLGIHAVLSNERQRRAMEVASYRFGRRMIWSRVAREYESIYRTVTRMQDVRALRPVRVPAHASIPSLLEAAD